MELDDIRALLQIVEYGSVQNAARHLNIPRSTLRRRLQSLEAKVGQELVVTSVSGVTLTAAGVIIAEEGPLLIERSLRMLSAARVSQEQASGILRVICPIGAPDTMHLSAIRALRSVAPGLCIEERELRDPLSHLHEPFDLMFYIGPVPKRGEWFSRVVHRAVAVPVASQAYLAEAGRPTTLKELAEHTIISWRRPGSEPTEWPLWAGGALRVKPMLISDNGNLIHSAAQQGVGITLGLVEQGFLSNPEPLIPVLDDVIGEELVVRCLSPMPTNADPRIRAALTSIQSFLDSLPQ